MPDQSGVVGLGPEYKPIRAEARRLVPEFVPGGGKPNGFSLARLGSLRQSDDGQHELLVWTRETAASLVRLRFDLDDLRAIAIGMLVYCEAVDAAASDGETA